MKNKPNLLLIGVDSLRRDRLSLYGYKRLTTPHIDNFFKEGVVFEKCFSPSIPTPPGYASIFTGMDCFGTDIVALRLKNGIAPEDISVLPNDSDEAILSELDKFDVDNVYLITWLKKYHELEKSTEPYTGGN